MSNIAIAATPASVPSHTSPPAGVPTPTTNHSLWAHGSFSFKDFLDIINPLQHLPIIGSVYRYLTGDEPSGGDRIAGDALYGGPIGLGLGLLSAITTNSKGQDLGEQVLADVFGPSDSETTVGKPAQLAAAAQPNNAAQATQPHDPTALAAVLYHSAPPLMPAAATAATTMTAPAPTASPPPASPAMPAIANAGKAAQSYLALDAQFQRQMRQGRGSNGQVLNDHPVPLELTSGLLPVNHPLTVPIRPAPVALAKPGTSAVAANPAANAAPLNPIAQKMLDALDKYDQMKKKEDQQNQSGSLQQRAPAKVDMSL